MMNKKSSHILLQNSMSSHLSLILQYIFIHQFHPNYEWDFIKIHIEIFEACEK